jgi:hypothetical protein
MLLSTRLLEGSRFDVPLAVREITPPVQVSLL